MGSEHQTHDDSAQVVLSTLERSVVEVAIDKLNKPEMMPEERYVDHEF